MYLFKIVFLSIGSIFVLFFITKFMGNKEMSQLSMFDYVIGITIGSIAAEMSTSLENNFWEPVIAIVVYGLVATLISYLSCKSITIRRFISGKSLILYDNGVLFRNNFAKAKLDINEFLMQCRINGYFNLADLQTAILEPNGKLSLLPSNLKRPTTPEDLNLSPPENNITINVIVDGVLLEENLKKSGHNLDWLNKKLRKQKNPKISDIFLATCDNKDNLSIYMKNSFKNSYDSFA